MFSCPPLNKSIQKNCRIFIYTNKKYFVFQFLVSVYPTDRTQVTIIDFQQEPNFRPLYFGWETLTAFCLITRNIFNKTIKIREKKYTYVFLKTFCHNQGIRNSFHFHHRHQLGLKLPNVSFHEFLILFPYLKNQSTDKI